MPTPKFDCVCPPSALATSLKILTKILKIKTANISSITAAPSIVVPSLVSNFFNSFNTSTEIDTEVAAKVTPRKIASSLVKL